ncbi:MAG: BCAM0308 family protein [Actinomycetota bacterium]|nr:BCAM0308 family protein [Actinomycetota bacterium]
MFKKCPQCGAIFDGRRWVLEPDERLERELKKGYESSFCPGDSAIKDGKIGGVVKIGGKFFDAHMDEITALLENVAERARKRNIASRIVKTEKLGNGLVVETTDEHLAEKIGKEIHKAFKGDLEIRWQEKDRFVRVSWKRD